MSIICTCGRASGPMCNGADGCPLNDTDGMPAPKIKTWSERLAEEQAKQQELLSKECNCSIPNTDLIGHCFKCGGYKPSHNTQLPAEWLEEIRLKAEEYANRHINGRAQPEMWEIAFKANEAGATEYATKLHQEQQEKAALKVKGETVARALRRLARSVSVHPEYSDESEWGDYVSGAEKALAQWEGGKAALYPSTHRSVVRETIEDVLLKTGKFTTCECSDIADAILKDLPKASDIKPLLKWLSEYYNEKGERIVLVNGNWCMENEHDINDEPITEEQLCELYQLQCPAEEPATPSKESDAVEFDSKWLIGRSKDRFNELLYKKWDWRSFYNGWIEGRADVVEDVLKREKASKNNDSDAVEVI
jgi:hypothetical protein